MNPGGYLAIASVLAITAAYLLGKSIGKEDAQKVKEQLKYKAAEVIVSRSVNWDKSIEGLQFNSNTQGMQMLYDILFS